MVMRLSPLALASSRVLQCVCPARRTLQGLNHDLLDLIVTDLARRPRSGFIIEPFQPSFQKTGTPFPHHAFRAAESLRHGLIVQTLGAGQHHSGAPRKQWLAARPMSQRLKSLALLFGQHQWLFGSSRPHPRPPEILDEEAGDFVH